jgi:hypothetical protein
MATRARTSGPQAVREEGNGTKTEGARDVSTTETRAGGPRTATLNLPFVTAQFRAPDLHVPSRQEIGSAARGARSMLPSRSSMLFYGGLAATAVVGAIEWPVAAAIGVGSALASRGAANPVPQQQEETAGSTGGAGNGRNK